MPARFRKCSLADGRHLDTGRYDPGLLASSSNTWAWEWGLHLRLVARVKPGIGNGPGHRGTRADCAHSLARLSAPALGLARTRSHHRSPPGLGCAHREARAACHRRRRGAGAGHRLCQRAQPVARPRYRDGEANSRCAPRSEHHAAASLRQLITESLSAVFARRHLRRGDCLWGRARAHRLSPPGLPRLDAIALDPAALIFALAITTAVGLLTGVIPAVHLGRVDLHPDFTRVRAAAQAIKASPAARWWSLKSRWPWCCLSAPGCFCAACSACSWSIRALKPATCSLFRCRPPAINSTNFPPHPAGRSRPPPLLRAGPRGRAPRAGSPAGSVHKRSSPQRRSAPHEHVRSAFRKRSP